MWYLYDNVHNYIVLIADDQMRAAVSDAYFIS